ncbi:glycosyltransferase, MGT family [[Leptolyngbya] sp. PCC 7376]|uniref:glycosyltransferase n=1 Tax=[Leptolyngbya] sp. PCC 7376 TaxID=111781 RepID=UPI00029F30C4|nr:nucleotide disphospho-sugar-binding domain-containing protein [[Leptolyngbya] sp. PCC 7376]AFY40280.1 glycosyltransferase, MGT family [[Leptolyngbya] sp. PCC 7376]
MTHFGIICPATTSHLNCMAAIGSELKQRGHRVTVLGIADAESLVLAANLDFHLIGESDFPEGYMQVVSDKIRSLKGFNAVKYTLLRISKGAELCFREIPKAIQTAGIEALLVDQATPAGGTIAEHLGIPFITVCNALMFNQEDSIPPNSLFWKYDPSWIGILRNKIGYAFVNRFGKSLLKLVNEWRRKWNLPIYQNFDQSYSKLAQITHLVAEFDFPKKELPPHFHFTGTYFNAAIREFVDFPYDKLTDQPLIYVYVGNLQSHLFWVFEMIAQACVDLDAQLVIALGGNTSPEQMKLAGDPIVVSRAPQLELLQRASLTITHAGLNTTLESLSNGVPIVAIPISNDQPGVAARIAWTKVGEAISIKQVNVKRLGQAIKQVLTKSVYKENALRLQKAIEQSGGLSLAANIIENAISTGQPVLAETLSASSFTSDQKPRENLSKNNAYLTSQ